jgi:hypothetical protein
MSKPNLVKIADILVAAGYSKLKVLRSVNYPKAEIIRIESESNEESIASLYDIFGKKKEIPVNANYNSADSLAYPGGAHVEVSIVPDGSWSISMSVMSVKFDNGEISKVAFGAEASGGFVSVPPIHRQSIPECKGWPIPRFLNPKYPAKTQS